MPRSRSPVSILQYPTMGIARQYWVVNRGAQTLVVDLYATICKVYDTYQRYITPHTHHAQIQAFLEELRFDTEPRLSRWPAVPRPDRIADPMVAEDWLVAFGVRHELVDLTEEVPGDINWSDVDENGNFEDDVNPQDQLFADQDSVANEIDAFMDRVLAEGE